MVLLRRIELLSNDYQSFALPLSYRSGAIKNTPCVLYTHRSRDIGWTENPQDVFRNPHKPYTDDASALFLSSFDIASRF